MKNVPFFEIPYEVFRSRIDKLKELMEANRLDAVILLCPENIAYYSGWRRTWIATQQEYGLIVSKEKGEVFFVPWMNSSTVDKTIWVEDIRTLALKGPKDFETSQDAAAMIKQLIRAHVFNRITS